MRWFGYVEKYPKLYFQEVSMTSEKKVSWGIGKNGCQLESAEGFCKECIDELALMAGCYNGHGVPKDVSEGVALRYRQERKP